MRALALAIAKKVQRDPKKLKAGEITASSLVVKFLVTVLTAATIVAIVDIVQVKKLSPFVLLGLIILCHIPYVGDVASIGILIYWAAVVRPNSQLLASMGKDGLMSGLTSKNLFGK